MRRVAKLAMLLVSGCAWLGASRPSTDAPAGPDPAYATRPTAEELDAKAKVDRLALFDALVEKVRSAHQFSPNTRDNLAPLTFDAALPELREAFGAAKTEADLEGALERLGNALHDGHAQFRPSKPHSSHITLPLVVTPEWQGHNLAMVVTESKAKGVEAGDIIASYAGTSAEALLRKYADRSNASDWHGIASGIAAWMTERPVDASDGTEWGVVTLGVRKADGKDTFVNVPWARGGWHGDAEADEAAPVLDHARCSPGLPVRKYPGYEVVGHGATYCLYVSKLPRYAAFPVVRFVSFEFGSPFAAEADYDHLARALRSLPAVRGVVVDLRDNRGGDDPKWVLDWFAPKPYLDLRTEVRKTPALEAITLADVVGIDEGWMKALSRAPTGATVARFQGCAAATCSDTSQRPAHRLVPVKAALIVGPRCSGACDHFARVWDENGLGPLVGEPSSGALTALRLEHPVITRDGHKLGTLGLALSADYSPFTSLPVEGLPIHIDIPVSWSWATRDTYDVALVDAALVTLAK